MRAYVHRVLLEFEADDIDIDQDLKVARKVFGDDFYREQYSQSSFDYLEQTMINAYSGATVDYRDPARSAALRKSPDEQIDWLKQGAEAVPECMYFHWELAQLYSQQGDSAAAAQSFARSQECYHHTASRLRPEDYYALGCELLEKVPSAFSDTARRDLTLADGEARMRWLVSLFQERKGETSVKLLSNFRYDSGTDLHPILFEFLRLHYEELRWQWALAWCDLCAVDEDYETRRYRYRGQALSANWDQPVRQVLGQCARTTQKNKATSRRNAVHKQRGGKGGI
jgi:hypothetical protein